MHRHAPAALALRALGFRRVKRVDAGGRIELELRDVRVDHHEAQAPEQDAVTDFPCRVNGNGPEVGPAVSQRRTNAQRATYQVNISPSIDGRIRQKKWDTLPAQEVSLIGRSRSACWGHHTQPRRAAY